MMGRPFPDAVSFGSLARRSGLPDPRMRRLLLALCSLAVPLAGTAQSLAPQGLDLADEYRLMDRLEQRRFERKPEGDLEQVFVVPERPGQNQVSWYRFDWHYLDVPAPGGGPGGIRLYYYQSERPQAERALPAIQSAYARLVEAFHYSPSRRIPYFLYATQREFQTQNIFQVSESVLGVTSPEDLKMTVPYFGDHSRFIEVSTHEMVHQFHIQKMMEQAGAEDIVSPIQYLPLWFTEGIAEYYSKGGIDAETATFLRDLLFNPDPERHYEVLPFAEDRLRGYIPTYKLGQARIAFIAEEYGREKIQAFIEQAYLMGEPAGRSAAGRGFAGLVRRVLNEPLEQVDVRWRAWLRRRYYPQYLEARQDLSDVHELRLPIEPESFSASADGQVLVLRGIDRQRGRARVFLVDVHNPRNPVELASDETPGFETLHPVEYGITAVGDGILAYSAQDGYGDRLYVHHYRRVGKEGGKPPPHVEVSPRRGIDVRPPEGGRFIVIADPAFSPDSKEIAFVGVASDGQQDIYVVPATGGTARRLTNDFFSEKDLAWSAQGIFYSSDATDHGRPNLFRLDPATGVRTRLTTAPTSDRHPHPQADGSVLFSSDAGGTSDLFLLDHGRIRRLTHFATGLSNPALAPRGHGAYASTFYGGLFRLVEVPRVAWLEEPPVLVAAAAGEPLPIPAASFPPEPPRYDPFALRNWRPEAGFIFGGGGAGGVAGRAAVLFDDVLRDHVLFLDVSVYGSFQYTQAVVLLENRAQRTGWVLGAFHYVQLQVDQRDANLAYYQRDFGLVGTLRYPLDRFRRFETELSLGGVQRYCLTDFSGDIALACGGIQSSTSVYPNDAAWYSQNGGVTFNVGPAVRFGYDTVRYDPIVGPLDGQSLLLELGGGYLPARQAVHGYARMDAQQFVQLVGRSKLVLRLASASSFATNAQSRTWERTWWVSSADNLRGYSPFDTAYLVGQGYWVVNAEFHLPMDTLIHLLFFDFIEGIAAVDFGGVFDSWDFRTGRSPDLTRRGPWDARTLTGVLGVNVLFGPLLLRFHFGHPFDIGGILTPALATHTAWVTNITLRYLFF